MNFFESVYAAVRLIPRGKVSTYGAVARAVGAPRCARHVGYALHVNPYFGDVPCHRVVFADGSLSKSFGFGGESAQRAMLEAEGVGFGKDGKVIMREFLWGNG